MRCLGLLFETDNRVARNAGDLGKLARYEGPPQGLRRAAPLRGKGRSKPTKTDFRRQCPPPAPGSVFARTDQHRQTPTAPDNAGQPRRAASLPGPTNGVGGDQNRPKPTFADSVPRPHRAASLRGPTNTDLHRRSPTAPPTRAGAGFCGDRRTPTNTDVHRL